MLNGQHVILYCSKMQISKTRVLVLDILLGAEFLLNTSEKDTDGIHILVYIHPCAIQMPYNTEDGRIQVSLSLYHSDT